MNQRKNRSVQEPVGLMKKKTIVLKSQGGVKKRQKASPPKGGGGRLWVINQRGHKGKKTQGTRRKKRGSRVFQKGGRGK